MDYSALNKCLTPQYLAHLENMKLRSETKREKDAADEAKTQAFLDSLMSSGDMKKCPYCSVLIERNGGCSKVLCQKCRCKFCWDCLMLETNVCLCRSNRHLWLDNTTGECEDVGDWQVAPLSIMRPDDFDSDDYSDSSDDGLEAVLTIDSESSSDDDSEAEPETKKIRTGVDGDDVK